VHGICGVAFAGLLIRDGEQFRTTAVHGPPEALAWRPEWDTALGRLTAGARFAEIADPAELGPEAAAERADVRMLLMDEPQFTGDHAIAAAVIDRREGSDPGAAGDLRRALVLIRRLGIPSPLQAGSQAGE
jgi:hypothetical protein